MIIDMGVQHFIKTQCGLDKYAELEKKKGIVRTIRLYWFVLFATIRDAIKW